MTVGGESGVKVVTTSRQIELNVLIQEGKPHDFDNMEVPVLMMFALDKGLRRLKFVDGSF
jgi:hypothetical protein